VHAGLFLSAGQRVRQDDAVVRGELMRSGFARAHKFAAMEKYDVAADGAFFIEQMQAKRRVTPRKIAKCGGDRSAVGIEVLCAAGGMTQDRRKLETHAHLT
jgi:hypothetical protein